MSEFGNAFKKARASGKKSFKFNGKSYTTQTKEEASPPVPKKRSMKGKVTVPTGPKATKLKGKVSDLPSKKSDGSSSDKKIRSARSRYKTYTDRKRALGN